MPEDAAPHEGQILRGSLFSEPMRVETVRASGDGTWILGLVGVSSERFRKVTLGAADARALDQWREVIPEYVKDYVSLNAFAA